MKWFRKWLENFKKMRCRHDPDMTIVLKESELCEPGEQSRKVKIRMINIKCTKCKMVLGFYPNGIAHDLVKGIIQDKNEKDFTRIPLTNVEKKELMKEIKGTVL